MVQPYPVASTTTRPSVFPHATPAQAWVLAPLIAGQPSYRTGRWIGTRFQYPRPTSPPAITGTLPRRPAAVMVHGTDGSVSTLCLDLDTSKALPGVVDADAARIRELLQRCSAAFVEDFSPSGGRHLYVPLRDRLRAGEARELVEALAAFAPSLDPSPHQNVTEGCIRVPGSPHKRGGHQTLVTPLSQAYAILRGRNSPCAIAALRTALAPELARNKAIKEHQTKAATATRPATSHLSVGGRSETPLRRVARTGVYDTAKYASPSEARMGVLNHFAACGWSLEDVQNELNGQFPGLAALYGTPAKQVRLLPLEWAKAQAWSQKTPSSRTTNRTSRINNTSPPVLTGGAKNASPAAVQQLVNDLENVLYAVLDHRLKDRGREGLGLRQLIRALLGYMRAKETDLLEVGCRSLAVAVGKHHTTVARLLPVLAAESEGMLTKVADARGKAADAYVLQLPDQYADIARELSWRKGKIHGIRPVFRALGDAAALVYEAIERARVSPTTADLIRTTGISATAVKKSLNEMTALGMIHRDGKQWRITTTASLTQLAIRMGVMDDYQAHISRNRRDRANWHAYLDRFLVPPILENEVYDEEREDYWIPPDLGAALWAA
jgi:hypothetical protein